MNKTVETNIKVNFTANGFNNIDNNINKTIEAFNKLADTMNRLSETNIGNFASFKIDNANVDKFINTLNYVKTTLKSDYFNMDLFDDEQLNEFINKLNDINETVSEMNSLTNELNNTVDTNDGLSNLFTDFQLQGESLNSFQERLSGLNVEGEDVNNTFNLIAKTLGGKLASSLGISTTQLGSLGATLGSIAAGLTIVWKLLEYIYNESQKLLKIIGDVSLKIGKTAISGLTSSFKMLTNAIISIPSHIKNIADAFNIITEASSEFYKNIFVLNQYLGSDGADALNEYNKALGYYKNINLADITENIRGLMGSLSNTAMSNKEIVEFSKNFEKFALDISAFTGSSLSDIGSQLEAALSFGVLNSRSSLARAIDITDAMIEEFKQLSTVEERAQWIMSRWPKFAGAYDKWIESDIGKVNNLKNVWNNLMNSVGGIATKVYAMVAPLLTNVLNVSNMVVDTLSSLIGDNNIQSIQDNINGYNDISDSINEIGKSAKKASNNLASFDDVIQLNKNTDSDNLGVNTNKLSDGLNNITKPLKKSTELWNKYKEAIQEALNNKDYKKAGNILSSMMVELTSFDVGEFSTKLNSISDAVSGFINGVFSPIKIKKIGSNAGEFINNIIVAIQRFFTTTDWNKVGLSIGGFITNMLNSIDSENVAEALYSVLNSAFGILQGLLSSDAIPKLFDNIGADLQALFDRLQMSDADYNKMAQSKNNKILNMQSKYGFVASESLLEPLIDDADNEKPVKKWADTLYKTIATTVASFIKMVINLFKSDSFRQSVRDIFETISGDFANDGYEVGNILVDIVTTILGFFNDVLGIEEQDGEFKSDTLDNIVDGAEGIAKAFHERKGEIIDALKPIFDVIKQALDTLMNSPFLDQFINDIVDILSEAGFFDLLMKKIGASISLGLKVLSGGLKLAFSSDILNGSVFSQLGGTVGDGIRTGIGLPDIGGWLENGIKEFGGWLDKTFNNNKNNEPKVVNYNFYSDDSAANKNLRANEVYSNGRLYTSGGRGF